MNKTELIDAVAARFEHSKKDVADIIEAVLEETKKAVNAGEKVAISGFGVFERRDRAARTGRNPRTGEVVKIKATKVPAFRAGAEFKAMVSGARKAVSRATADTKATPAKAAKAAKAAPAKAAKAAKAAPAKAAAAKTTAKAAAKAPAKTTAKAAKAAPAKAPAKAAAAKAAPAKATAAKATKAPAKAAKAPAKRTATKAAKA